MYFIKLKDNIQFNELEKFGFEEDTVNCEQGDYYYYLNNYYAQIDKEFRISINMHSRYIELLCLPSDLSVHNIYNLKPLVDLIINDLVEIEEK